VSIISNITHTQKEVLQIIKEKQPVKTTSLWELDKIQDFYSSHGSLNNALNNIEDTWGFIESKNTRPKVWSLTDNGEKKLSETENDSNEAVVSLPEDSEIDKKWLRTQINNYIKEHARKNIVESVVDGKHAVTINHEHLAKYNVKLADQLSTNPGTVIPLVEETLAHTGFIDNNPELRITDLSGTKTRTVSTITEDDMGRFISVEGILQSVTEPKMRMAAAVYECQNCHETYETDTTTNDGSVKQPSQCRCGNKKQFSRVQTKWEQVRILSVKEKPGRGKRHQLKVEVSGQLAKDRASSFKATGSAITVYGLLDTYKEKKSSSTFNVMLKANNVVIDDGKWEEPDLDNDQIEAVKQVRNSYSDEKLPKVLRRSLAHGRIAHMELLKESMIVWLLGRSEEDGNTHVLCVGEPGLAKSDLAGYVKDVMPRVLKASGTSSTGVGLTASVTEDKIIGGYVAEAGSLAMADGGFHFLDEAGKLDGEDMKKLNEALSDEVITLDKASIHTEIPADVASFAIANPENGLIDKHQELYKQFPIGYSELVDRFDLKIGLRRRDLSDDGDRRVEEDIVDVVLRRGNGVKLDKDDVVSEDVLRDYILYAQQLDPSFSDEALDVLRDVFFSLRMQEGDGEHLWDIRRLVTLKKVSRAYARMCLSETVEAVHARLAAGLMRRSLESIDFVVGEDSLSDLHSDGGGDDSSGGLLAVIGDDEELSIDDLVERIGWSEDAVEDRVDELKTQAKLYEPKNGVVSKL